jgi:hypothetical protein
VIVTGSRSAGLPHDTDDCARRRGACATRHVALTVSSTVQCLLITAASAVVAHWAQTCSDVLCPGSGHKCKVKSGQVTVMDGLSLHWAQPYSEVHCTGSDQNVKSKVGSDCDGWAVDHCCISTNECALQRRAVAHGHQQNVKTLSRVSDGCWTKAAAIRSTRRHSHVRHNDVEVEETFCCVRRDQQAIHNQIPKQRLQSLHHPAVHRVK